MLLRPASWNRRVFKKTSKNHVIMHGRGALRRLQAFATLSLSSSGAAAASLRKEWGAVLRQCSKTKDVAEGKRAHGHIVKAGYEKDSFLANHLVQMYGKCGRVEDARLVFDKISKPDAFSWTMMIVAYAENGRLRDARNLFAKLAEPTVVCWNAMVAAYTQSGHMQDATALFYKMPERDVVTWNTMIAGYARNGHSKEALQVFRAMDLEGVPPSDITLVAVLDACGNLGEGKAVHRCLVGNELLSGIKVGNALISMYGRWGGVEEAASIFHHMPGRNVVSWTALITAYAHNGHGKEALGIFRRMNLEGTRPNEITVVSALQACATVAALAEGKTIHLSVVTGGGLECELNVGNALVSMYSKCGSLELAYAAFKQMLERDVVSFNVIVAAYAQNGHANEALEFCKQMGLEGVQPNKTSLTSILSACNHAGLPDEGWQHFTCMSGDHGLAPALEHFACMVDLLGRGGRVAEAEELIENMPFEPDYIAWSMLLAACRAHGDAERAARASQHMRALRPDKSSPYVLLFNTHTSADAEILE